jgi:hypothetical protein
MVYRFTLMAALVLSALPALSCSAHIPSRLFTNVVRLEGPAIEGLKWVRTYNMFDYEGDQRVRVSAVIQGRRVPLAKWESGQQCGYDSDGAESCSPNRPNSGVPVQNYFGEWTDAADRRDALRKLFLPLIIEVEGREIPLTLRSRPVRSTRELRSERAMMLTNEICERMNSP